MKSARRKKKRLEQFAQTQKGALDRFVVKQSQTSEENQIVQANINENNGDDTNNVEANPSDIDEVRDSADIVRKHALYNIIKCTLAICIALPGPICINRTRA